MPVPQNSQIGDQTQTFKQGAIYPADSILKDFVDYAQTVSEAADCFLLGSILPVAAAILSRGVWLPWLTDRLYPNIFVIICAKPGDRKTSTINIARNIAKDCLPIEAFLPKAFSPEALVDEYDDNCGGRADKLLIADDGNAILSDWHLSLNGERNATRFLELYDCKELTEAYRRNKQKGGSGPSRRTIAETSTSVLIGATPNIARFQNQTVQAGLQRRFLYYVAEELERTLSCPQGDLKAFASLCHYFQRLKRLSGVVQMSQGAQQIFDLFQANNRAERDAADRFDEALLSRLATAPTSVLKLAMIFEVCRSAKAGSNNLVIQPLTVQLAVEHVAQCSAAAAYLEIMADRQRTVNEADYIFAKIQTDYRSYTQNGEIILSKSQLIRGFANNGSRGRTVDDLNLRLLPHLIQAGKARRLPKQGKLEQFSFPIEK